MQSETFAHLIRYGTESPPSAGIALRAGPLQLTYVDGALRYIKHGDEELLRMVYVAVRDRNWDTVQPELHIVRRDIGDDAFELLVTAKFRNGEIVFDAAYHITGTDDGKISFGLTGMAGRSFLRNRIGFCILHPIKGCKGVPCEITGPSGSRYVADFPVEISAHQPFKEVQRMHWRTASGTGISLEMKGDVFETEDQRNWTDASYKTYCTPLERPFPVRMAKGEEVRQAVLFSIGGVAGPNTGSSKIPTASIGEGNGLPSIRMGLDSGEKSGLRNHAIRKRIAALRLDHLRVAINLGSGDWQSVMENALAECAECRIQLFVALFAGESVDIGFLEWVSAYADHVGYVLLLTAGHKATAEEAARNWLPRLRTALPGTLLGIGTDAYFAELNRLRPNADGFDFVGFSVNPQVHAFDHASLVETLEAQREVVQSAQRLYPGKYVFVSPVTLKPRHNPNATAVHAPLPDRLPEQVDGRQGSLFAAGWTVGSIAALAEAGVYGANYYEAVGERGVFIPDDWARHPLFPAYPADFPVFAVLEFIGGIPPEAVLLPVTSSAPLQCSALAYKMGKRRWLLLANHTDKPYTVKLENGNGLTYMKQLHANWPFNTDWLAEFWAADPDRPGECDGNVAVELPPFGIALVSSDKSALERAASG